MDTRTTLSH